MIQGTRSVVWVIMVHAAAGCGPGLGWALCAAAHVHPAGPHANAHIGAQIAKLSPQVGHVYAL